MRSLVLLAFFLAGCVTSQAELAAPTTPAPLREEIHHLASPVPPRAATTPSDGRTVVVVPMIAEGALKERALLYTPNGLEAWPHPHLFWDEPLPERLGRELIRYLRAAGPFAGVLGGPASQAQGSDLVLTPRLLRFEHYVSPSAPGITVSLELTLYDPVSDTVRMVATYTETVPLDDDAIDTAVEAQSQAVGRIFARFLRDLGV